MYLGVVYVTLALDAEMLFADRERILRKIRDKMRESQGKKIAIYFNDEDSIGVSYLAGGFQAVQDKLNAIVEYIDNLGEARISHWDLQVFQYYEGSFRDVTSPDGQIMGEIQEERSQSAGRKPIRKSEFIRYQEEPKDLNFTPTRFSKPSK